MDKTIRAFTDLAFKKTIPFCYSTLTKVRFNPTSNLRSGVTLADLSLDLTLALNLTMRSDPRISESDSQFRPAPAPFAAAIHAARWTLTPPSQPPSTASSLPMVPRHAPATFPTSGVHWGSKEQVGKKKMPGPSSIPQWLRHLQWSGRLDLNQRPLAPQASALPGCATPRCESIAVMPPRLGNVKVSDCRTTSAESLLAPARALGTLPGVGGASLQFRSGVERAF